MSNSDAPPSLNPAQREVLDLLGARRDERPAFPSALGSELEDELADRLALTIAAVPAGEDLWVAKHALAQIHTCEANYLAELDVPFAWSVPTARGTIAHKAIELLVNWKQEPVAGELVAEALARLRESNDQLADWLQTLGDGPLAELTNECTDLVAKFVECFPPLQRSWQPVAESRLRVQLGPIVLAGKVDLALGRTRGNEAGKVFIDLKTGGQHTTHLDDLRFYALLETIRLGVPPRAVASYYLDAARTHVEAVSEATLRAALARTVDGVQMIVALRYGDQEARRRAGPTCRWCPIAVDCETGHAWLHDRGESSDDP